RISCTRTDWRGFSARVRNSASCPWGGGRSALWRYTRVRSDRASTGGRRGASCFSTRAARRSRASAPGWSSNVLRSSPASPSGSRPIPCATASPPTCSRAARTCGRSRRCWDTPTSLRRSSTPTWTGTTSAACTGSIIRGREPHAQPMLFVLDNYDSFTYNLVQLFGELGQEPVVYRNDALTVEEVLALKPRAAVLSPGPCQGRRDHGYEAPEVSHLRRAIPSRVHRDRAR